MDDDLALMDDDDGGSDAPWMATFADLMSLLLTFFVLLLSFANMDIVEFRMALGSVKDAMGVESEFPGSFEALSTTPIEMSDKPSSDRLDLMEEMRLLNQVKEAMKDAGVEQQVETSLSDRGVVVRVEGELLFGSGRAELRAEQAEGLFRAITAVSESLRSKLLIEGHTDDRPMNSSRYPSNWELSTARAIATMRNLVDQYDFNPARVGVAGYAHLRPIADNETQEGRDRNRRVEFIFLKQSDKDAKHEPLVGGGERASDAELTPAASDAEQPADTAAGDTELTPAAGDAEQPADSAAGGDARQPDARTAGDAALGAAAALDQPKAPSIAPSFIPDLAAEADGAR